QNLWLGTGGGLLVYHSSTLQPDSSLNNLINSIDRTEVMTIFHDRSDNIWIGSFHGLFKVKPAAPFNHITANATGRFRISANRVFGIRRAASEKAWVGYLFEKEKFTLLDFKNKESGAYFIQDHNEAHLKQLINQSAVDIFCDSLEFWLEKYRNGTDANSFIASHGYDNTLPGIIGSCLRKTYPAINSKHIETFDWNNDYFWIASPEGLIRVNRKTSETVAFHPSSSKNSINTGSITCLLAENNGDVWIGTNGGGLNHFDRATNSFDFYTTSEGLAHNSIYSLVKDHKGRLWIGTGNGLSCFFPSNKQFRNFYPSDGLINSEYNRFSACRLENGWLLMGGMEGIDYFHPDSVLKEEQKPIVQISEIKVQDKSWPVANRLNLTYDQNYLTISFAAMDFRNPAANRFAYKLQGIDKDWVQSSQNSVSYASLSPGSYHFLVKASNPSGTWSDTPASVLFTIYPPWWKSWWFVSIAASAILALLYGIYRFRIHQLKKVLAVRSKISRDLHDEVGATLSGIAMYSHLLNQQLKENQLTAAGHSLHVIQNSASEMVDRLSDIVWVVNPQHDSLGQLLRKLEEYACEIARARNMEVIVSVDKGIAPLKLPMESRRNIYLACKEAINNAVKYSEASSLELLAVTTDHVVELILRDNGKGFDPDQVRKGNGIHNMQQRMREAHAEITLESKPGNGTTWKIVYHL
ncbi:MAG TPA: triple tyrosine motif-containing protein, partial [Chryseosolibacter sp.]|nr:triple tyrosine motif-containing protein [Chryseosolibacter sp.]